MVVLVDFLKVEQEARDEDGGETATQLVLGTEA